MKYASIRSLDITNGKGVGVAVFVQGCPIPHCPNCFNPETWSFNGGKEWTRDVEDYFFNLINRPYINRISFLGGECLCGENIKDITDIAKKCKEMFPKKEIWLWSRYDFKKDISNKDIINYLDYIIDGQYIDEQRDITAHWRGSTNQRIWHNDNGVWADVTDAMQGDTYEI